MSEKFSSSFDDSIFFGKALELGNRLSSTSHLQKMDRRLPDEEGTAIFKPLRNYVCWDEVDANEALEDIVRKRDDRGRKPIPVVLDFGDKFKIGLSIFSPFIVTNIPTPQRLDAKTQQLLSVNTTFFCQDIGRTLNSKDLVPFFQYGNHSRIFLTEEEWSSIRNFGDPATIKLVGFKSQSSIKVRFPYILLPHLIFFFSKSLSHSSSVVLCNPK